MPFVNSMKSLIFVSTKIILPKRFDCEGYALSGTFYRIEIELLVFKLCPVCSGSHFSERAEAAR